MRHEGDWDGWLKFFLRGVAETAAEAAHTALAIVNLREAHQHVLRDRKIGTNGMRLLDLLFQRPLVNTALVMRQLGVTDVTASKLIGELERVGLLDEITGKKRFRMYRYTPYWQLFQDVDELEETSDPDIIASV